MDAAQFNASVRHFKVHLFVKLTVSYPGFQPRPDDPPQKVTSCGHLSKLTSEPSQLINVSISLPSIHPSTWRFSAVVKLLGQISSSAPWHRVALTCGIVANQSGLGSARGKHSQTKACLYPRAYLESPESSFPSGVGSLNVPCSSLASIPATNGVHDYRCIVTVVI